MELQQLRYVVAVAETSNFTRAAERCHVVQSALSHQVAKLEHELGAPLFARTSRRVRLTAAGEAFLPLARETLAGASRAADAVAATIGEVRGPLTVGLIPTVAAVDVPAALARFRERHPQVRIALRSGGSDDLAAAVREGAIDVAFLGLPVGPPPRGLGVRELARERLVAVVAPGRQRGPTDLAALAGETFVDFPAGTPGRRQSDLAFTAAGLTRDVAFEVMDVALMGRLVAQGLAVALLAEAFAPRVPGVVAVPVRDAPERVEYVVWSALGPSPAALALLETLG